MQFVRLTRGDDQKPIFVAARHVAAVQGNVNMPGTAVVRLLDGEHHWVRESPEDVVTLLEQALGEQARGG